MNEDALLEELFPDVTSSADLWRQDAKSEDLPAGERQLAAERVQALYAGLGDAVHAALAAVEAQRIRLEADSLSDDSPEALKTWAQSMGAELLCGVLQRTSTQIALRYAAHGLSPAVED